MCLCFQIGRVVNVWFFFSFSSMIPSEKVIYNDTVHLCVLPWKSVWENWVVISILNISAKKWRQSCDLLKAIQKFTGKTVSKIQVYVYVPSNFFFSFSKVFEMFAAEIPEGVGGL